MSREKVLRTRTKTPHAQQLQQQLLAYHDFREERDQHPLRKLVDQLGQWQSVRLKQTHKDLYATPRYHDGLEFLLTDLYTPREFIRRDDDLERIFPVMVTLLPDSVLRVVAELVELNLLTQRLDQRLAEVMHAQPGFSTIDTTSYAGAYRLCDNREARLHQIQLVANIGNDLERYVGKKSLSFALSITEGAADMAGVGPLHRFLRRGLNAFRAMGGVDDLLDRIVDRERRILDQLLTGRPTPFELGQP